MIVTELCMLAYASCDLWDDSVYRGHYFGGWWDALYPREKEKQREIWQSTTCCFILLLNTLMQMLGHLLYFSHHGIH
jgi:hypothetical protein